MSGQAPITISQEFEIVSPEARKAYVVLIDEWDYLKKKISRIMSTFIILLVQYC